MKKVTSTVLAFLLASSLSVSSYEVQERDQLQSAIERRIEAKQDLPDTEETYGFILNGDTSDLHRRNVSLGYQGMREMDIPAENVIILTVPDNGTYSDFEGALIGQSQKEEVESIFMRAFPELVDANDTAVIYLTGHGYLSPDGTSDVMLSGVRLPSEYYAQTIDRMDAALSLTIADICYSGDFISALRDIDDPYIAISSTEGKERTCCGVFAETFWTNVTTPSVDTDHDGSISMEELFTSTNRRHASHMSNSHPDLDGQQGSFQTNTASDSYQIRY